MDIKFAAMYQLNMNIYPVSDLPGKRFAKRANEIVANARISVAADKNGGGHGKVILTDDDATNFLKQTYPKAKTEGRALSRAKEARKRSNLKGNNNFFYKLQAFIQANPKDASGNPAVTEEFLNEPGDREDFRARLDLMDLD